MTDVIIGVVYRRDFFLFYIHLLEDMPKTKSKKSKPTRTASVHQEVKEPIPWRQQLREFDLNKIDSGYKVELVILNECLPKYFDDIEKFQKYCYTRTISNIKPVIYEEILYLVKHYPAWDRHYLSSDIESILEAACEEAKNFLELHRPIPLDFMAELIKLRIILFIKEDIYNEKFTSKVIWNQTMSTDFTESIESVSFTERLPSKESFPEQQKYVTFQDLYDNTNNPTIDPYVHEYDTVDVFFNTSSIVLQEYIRTMKRRQNTKPTASDGFLPTILDTDRSIRKQKQFKTPWAIRHNHWLKTKKNKSSLNDQLASGECDRTGHKLLHAILTGFYDPFLIMRLNNVGLSVTCIVSLALNDDKPVDPTTPFDIKTTNLSSPFTVVPVYDYTLQCMYKYSKNPVKICDLNYDDMKDQLVYHFWSTLDELFDSNYETMKDVMCLVCPPANTKGQYVEPETKEYIEQSEHMYNSIVELLQRLPRFRRWHSQYLKDLQVIDLGDAPEKIPANEMFYYNKVLDKYPQDCYSVDLMMDGLLEEVQQKTLEANPSFTSLENEDIERIEECKKFLRTKKLCNHILNKHKFKYVPANLASFYQKHRSMFPRSKKVKHTYQRFQIRQDDNLELKAMYYPKFAEKLRTRSMECLKKTVPASLWNLYSTVRNVSNINVNQFHTWSSLLRLSPQEITESLEVCSFNLMRCERKQKPEIISSEMLQYFPEPTKLDNSIYIDHDGGDGVPKQSDENIYEYYGENYFQWRENLKPSVLLQKLNHCNNHFQCMDHEYIPFLDSVIVRFHDNCDKFGITSNSYKEALRAPVNLHDFFKSSIFEDRMWFLINSMLYELPENNECLTSKVDLEASKSIGTQEKPPSQNNCRSPSVDSITIRQLREHFLSKPFIGYNLNRRHEVHSVSTVFHSLDGLKVTVEKTLPFCMKPYLTLKLEANSHTLFLYICQKSGMFSFDIEASNGTRFVFSKSEPAIESTSKKMFTARKPRPKKSRCYSIKEIDSIGFTHRLSLCRMHFIKEDSLLKILKELTSTQSFSSTQTLQLLESKKSILFKTTSSTTDVRWRHRISPVYLQVVKAISKLKRDTIPQFKILSSALHKHKFIKVARMKIFIRFADGIRVLRYIPNLDLKKKIEISKCMRVKAKYTNSSGTIEQATLENTYDTKLSLPNGLQIAFEATITPEIVHAIQYYIPNNPNMPDEMTRIFTRDGHIQIRYRDGSMKIIGLYGRRLIGELPHITSSRGNKLKKRRNVEYLKSPEDTAIARYTALLKKIHGKVYRYQSKFIHTPFKNYLRRSKNNMRSVIRKALSDETMENSSDAQLQRRLNFHVPEECCNDSYTSDAATMDSYTSINAEGELTTIYADGTRITSWFKVDQEMIIVAEDGGELELDVDDYTCNFLVPRKTGWISVQIFYQYEHPHYATVVCGANSEMSIRLPDNLEYQAKTDGTFHINVQDEMYARINTDNVQISTNYCKNCYRFCQTTINVKYLFSNEQEVGEDEVLLEAKDSFNKVFKVNYDGTCSRNLNYSESTKPECQAHKIVDTQKFFIFDEKFNGKMYWTDTKLQNKLIDIQNNTGIVAKKYLDELDTLKVYDFLKYFYIHYSERFLMPYGLPSPSIFSYQSHTPRNVCYTTKRQIYLIPECTRVRPLFQLIQDLRVKSACELPLPKFENIFQLEEYLHPKPVLVHSSSTDTINMKLAPVFADVAVENFAVLMKKVREFKIDTMEDNNFEINAASSVESAWDIFQESNKTHSKDLLGKEIHLKLLHQKMLQCEREQNQNKTKKKRRHRFHAKKVSMQVPPVPKNSTVTVDSKEIPQEIEERTISLSDFGKSPNRRPARLQVKKSVDVFKQNISSLLLHTPEWRKPVNLLESNSSIALPMNNILKKENTRTRDKQVWTTTPFDLFCDNQNIVQADARQVDSTAQSSKHEQEKHSSEDQFDIYGIRKKCNKPVQVESKQSRLMSGVHVMESYKEVYEKFVHLYKDMPKDMKRFTELYRNVNEKSSLKNTGSNTCPKEESKVLPLILPSTDASTDTRKKDIVDATTSKKETVSEDTKLVKSISIFNDVKFIPPKTLEALSKRKLSQLCRAPSDLDKKIHTKFIMNLPTTPSKEKMEECDVRKDSENL